MRFKLIYPSTIYKIVLFSFVFCFMRALQFFNKKMQNITIVIWFDFCCHHVNVSRLYELVTMTSSFQLCGVVDFCIKICELHSFILLGGFCCFCCVFVGSACYFGGEIGSWQTFTCKCDKKWSKNYATHS